MGENSKKSSVVRPTPQAIKGKALYQCFIGLLYFDNGFAVHSLHF
jgi:hypothetical protein